MISNKVDQRLMDQVVNLYGWEHIRIIEILDSKNILMEIKKLEPTMVPAFLLGVDRIKINLQRVLVNKDEKVTLAVYYNLSDSLLGYAVFYKGDIAYECKSIGELDNG